MEMDGPGICDEPWRYSKAGSDFEHEFYIGAELDGLREGAP